LLAVVLFTVALAKVALAPAGWLTTVQVPVPLAGALPAKVAVLVQIFCVAPALETVGTITLVTTTSLVELAQEPLATVQRNV
jgi:hypothetical protein